MYVSRPPSPPWSAADPRDRAADPRDRAADPRDRAADPRDRAADPRDLAAEARDRAVGPAGSRRPGDLVPLGPLTPGTLRDGIRPALASWQRLRLVALAVAGVDEVVQLAVAAVEARAGGQQEARQALAAHARRRRLEVVGLGRGGEPAETKPSK
jgi:hypothetical protein